MTPEIAVTLRKPFDAELIGKLPRVYCRACKDAQFKVCEKHTKRKCRDCGNNITDAHLHLDYIGHAETTDRFLSVDPEWTWEPVAFDANGLPAFDRFGGLWIRLTIAGVTRLGYGAATEGKNPGPDAVKEIIGDALRNAGMRFGVALDLWGAKFKNGTEEHGEAADPEQWDEAKPAKPSAAVTVLFEQIAHASTPDELRDLWQLVNKAGATGEIVGPEVAQLKSHITKRGEEIGPGEGEPA